MRKRNWRFVLAGGLLVALAAVFFFVMTPIAPQSTDPVEFMRLVGQASGVAAGIGVALAIIGLIGKKA